MITSLWEDPLACSNTAPKLESTSVRILDFNAKHGLILIEHLIAAA